MIYSRAKNHIIRGDCSEISRCLFSTMRTREPVIDLDQPDSKVEMHHCHVYDCVNTETNNVVVIMPKDGHVSLTCFQLCTSASVFHSLNFGPTATSMLETCVVSFCGNVEADFTLITMSLDGTVNAADTNSSDNAITNGGGGWSVYGDGLIQRCIQARITSPQPIYNEVTTGELRTSSCIFIKWVEPSWPVVAHCDSGTHVYEMCYFIGIESVDIYTTAQTVVSLINCVSNYQIDNTGHGTLNGAANIQSPDSITMLFQNPDLHDINNCFELKPQTNSFTRVGEKRIPKSNKIPTTTIILSLLHGR